VKTCACCKQDLPFSAFHKNKYEKDGYQIYCIECREKKRKAGPVGWHFTPYTWEELYHRPKEHALEQISATKLMKIIDCSESAASRIKRNPDLLGEEGEIMLFRWLKEQAGV